MNSACIYSLWILWFVTVVAPVRCDGQTNDNYYAPEKTKYDSGRGLGVGGGEIDRCRWAYQRFDLLLNVDCIKRSYWGTNFFATVELAKQKISDLESASGDRSFHWTNKLQRAKSTLLRVEQDKSKGEERVYKAYIEYIKPNPLSFIPNTLVREEFLSKTNKLSAEDWKQLKRLEDEKEKRREIQKVDLGKLNLEISEAYLQFRTGKVPQPIPADFKLPKPD